MKIKRYKIKGISMQIEKLNDDVGGACAAKFNGTSKYRFFLDWSLFLKEKRLGGYFC